VAEQFNQPTAERINEQVWARAGQMAAKDFRELHTRKSEAPNPFRQPRYPALVFLLTLRQSYFIVRSITTGAENAKYTKMWDQIKAAE